MVYHRTKFYLLGYDYNHKGIRAFSVNKIQNCELSDKKFVLPADFDAQNYWHKIFWKKYYKKAETVVLIFEKLHTEKGQNDVNNSHFEGKAHRMPGGEGDVLLERIKNWEKVKIKKLSDKSTEATFKTLNFDWLKEFILSCGKRVKVKKPDWLREDIKKEIQEMNEFYK